MTPDENDGDSRRPLAPQHPSKSEERGVPARKSSRRTRLVIALILLVGLAAAALWLIRYETRSKYMEATNDAAVAADVVTVSPRIAGYVASVLVADNQDVRAGQPLVRIDPRDAHARADQAEAQIALAEAQADGARAQAREQDAAIEQARAQLAAARSKARYDAGEVARYRPLAASGAETGQQLRQLEEAARQSAENLRSQAAALSMQQRRVAGLQSQVRQGVAQGYAARSQLSAASVDVAATEIRAPIAGRIGDKTVTVGQYLQPGMRLLTVVPLNRLYISANFKETQLALMRPGQPASIKVDALGGLTVKGRVESLAPGTGALFSILPPQNATGNFTKVTQRVPVRVSIEATPTARRLLVPGLSVTVTVDTRSARQELDRVRAQQDAADRSGRDG